MPRYRAIFTEPPIQFNRQDFSHNVLFAMPKPNSAGGFNSYSYTGASSWGNIAVVQGDNQHFSLVLDTNTDNIRNTQVNISLNQNSSIYQNGITTVQPEAVMFQCLIRYAA